MNLINHQMNYWPFDPPKPLDEVADQPDRFIYMYWKWRFINLSNASQGIYLVKL
jgi:hypothetical protein